MSPPGYPWALFLDRALKARGPSAAARTDALSVFYFNAACARNTIQLKTIILNVKFSEKKTLLTILLTGAQEKWFILVYVVQLLLAVNQF